MSFNFARGRVLHRTTNYADQHVSAQPTIAVHHNDVLEISVECGHGTARPENGVVLDTVCCYGLAERAAGMTPVIRFM